MKRVLKAPSHNSGVSPSERTKELIPLETRHGVKFMSIEPFLPEGETPLLWEGALRTRFIVDTLSSTRWGELDIMVYDLPPGTGDEVITIAQVIPPPRFAIIVSSPGKIAEPVVRKAIVFAQKMQLPIMGLVENMSYVKCRNSTIEVFGESSAERLSKEYGIEVLARIPLDPLVRRAHDEGKPVFEIAPGSEVDQVLEELSERVFSSLKLLGIL
jgi:ATP-binding protein involved in chromosome partitioning